MIQGVVTANLEAIVSVTVMNDIGQQIVVDAAIDTGFNGNLTLPVERITELGLTQLYISETILANGQRVKVNIYSGKVLWHGQLRIILIEEAPDRPLIGMELLLDSLLTIDVRYNGAATISENP